MEAVTAYKTEDGHFFENEADAIEHEQECELIFQVDVFYDGFLNKEGRATITRNMAYQVIAQWMEYKGLPIGKINTED